MPKKMGFHPLSLFSPYGRGDALLDVFWPWANPVSRNLLGWAWQGSSPAATVVFAGLFVLACVGFAWVRPRPYEPARERVFPVILLLLLMLGTTLIYVFAGGFSVDSRKRYAFLPIWLMVAAWAYRAVARERKLPRSAGLYILLATGAAGCASTWLIIGIWRHEVVCYNELARYIAREKISGAIDVRWNPDIYQAWPQFARSMGSRLDEDWVINLAVAGYGGAPVRVTNEAGARRIVCDPKTGRWSMPH